MVSLLVLAICSTLLLFQIRLVKSECPNPSDLPVVSRCYMFEPEAEWASECPGDDYGKDKYVAFQHFEDGSPQPITSCTGDMRQLIDGVDETPPCGYHFTFSSLVIRPGCTFHGFERCYYNQFEGGFYDKFDGPMVISQLDRTYSSFKARCGLEYINCIPTDGYKVVLWCDATNAIESVLCTYQKSIGTSFTQEISQTASIDVTIESYIESEFWGLFTTHVGISTTTGYSWTDVTSEVKDETETFTVEATAPAGKILVIEQTIGNCGSNVVNTEMFKITHQDKDGNVSDIRYELAYRNGTVVVVDGF